MNLSVKIGNITFQNPVTFASGTFGYIEKYYHEKDIKNLGALIPKTVTLFAQEGNPPPRIVETPAGMVNAIGIENLGVDDFIKNKWPKYKPLGVPVIVSVSGRTDEEFQRLTEKINEIEVAALELNLSCPNLKEKNLVAQDKDATYRIVNSVKKISKAPVIAKLTPNVTDITVIAKAAQDAGADAISLINTLAAMVIDIKTRQPVLGNGSGGLSGPAIRPIAVHMVYRTARCVKIPIIGMGGIMDARDAIEFFLAGATMVAVGTMNFVNPKAPLEILAGIKDYLRQMKIKDIKEIIGSVK